MQFLKLKKPSKSCAQCKQTLEKWVYSELSDDMTRKDRCASCFSLSEKPQIWWKTELLLKPKNIALTDYEKKLYELFASALEDKSKQEEWIYFLAHYFRRRKIFISQGECAKEGKTYEILECKLTQEVYFVPKSLPSSTLLNTIVEELKHVQPA